MSQTLDAQTSGPIVPAGVQTPVNEGVCPDTVGMGCPLAIFATHVELGVSQYWLGLQSLSMLQPLESSHLPLLLHAPERHTATPEGAGVHEPSPSA